MIEFNFLQNTCLKKSIEVLISDFNIMKFLQTNEQQLKC